jgi:hypothetical protein
MTQETFLPKIQEMETKLNIKLRTFCIPCNTIFEAACARLAIFDYPNINNYEKLLYLDTDIIIKNDIKPIFDLEIDDLLYAIESGTINSPSFGSYFLDLDTIDINTTGMNSGTLLFKNSETMKSLFNRINQHITEYTNEGKPPLYCMDQPFINFHAIKDKLYNNQLLNPYVSLFEDNATVNNYDTSSICHFAYPIGHFEHKYYRMGKFFLTLLTIGNKHVSIDPEGFMKMTIPENTSHLIGKKYSWGTGFIRFEADRLVTTWTENGTYNHYEPKMVVVLWNNHFHTLIFNDDFTNYMSIRTHPEDFEITYGSLLQG